MSKDKMIEEMAKISCNTNNSEIKWECAECPFNTVCDIQISCEALYNAGYRKQEWISVEERLPEIEGDARTWGELKIRKSVRVLCACKQKSGKILVKEGYCEVWGASQRAYWKIPGSIDEVTHWMPLPEAPKMKGGAE